ncbi:MAG: hypothetical protein JNM63_08010, partial [Spirochaetia bacterium]|nr:hypothetical protein [Spirochaetia bacterium]
AKLPKAKTIVCLGDLSSYSANPEGVYYMKWSRAVLEKMASLGMSLSVDYFAPHLYPFLSDTTNHLHQNYLEDWCVRNIYRCLDLLEKMLDDTGFKESRFFVSEWGAQSDGVAGARRNDLIASMAGGLATAKTIMAIYSHPRVEAGTFHPFIHSSRVSPSEKKPINAWGAQSVFYFTESRSYKATPVLEAERMFVNFARKATLLPEKINVPKGVQVIAASDEKGKKYFVVNGTRDSVRFPDSAVKTRVSLFTDKVASGAILRYGSYGDKDGDVSWIVPREFGDAVLPPYSVNVLK